MCAIATSFTPTNPLAEFGYVLVVPANTVHNVKQFERFQNQFNGILRPIALQQISQLLYFQLQSYVQDACH
jgi:hypothetical protein